MPDSAPSKTESNLNTDYNSNSQSVEISKNYVYHNSNYINETKQNQSQMKIGSYENSNLI